MVKFEYFFVDCVDELDCSRSVAPSFEISIVDSCLMYGGAQSSRSIDSLFTLDNGGEENKCLREVERSTGYSSLSLRSSETTKHDMQGMRLIESELDFTSTGGVGRERNRWG